MSKKTLNKANLETLGAERLAALVMELVQGNAALQRRARLELSAAQGPKEVAADIRKRFVSLRRATSRVDWRRQRTLVKDLDGLLGMIETNILPLDAAESFELLWSFLQLAPSIHERADDSSGAIGDAMAAAVDLIAKVAPRLSLDQEVLADRILEAVAEAGHGEFDGIIPATAEALGAKGLEHLKLRVNAWADQPPTEQDLERFRGHGISASPAGIARRNRQITRSVILADIADVQGDVDAYMARYTQEQLTFGTIAPDVARRLLDVGRLDEAFEIVSRARTAEEGKGFRASREELDAVHEECLEKLGRIDTLKDHLWDRFRQDLDTSSLRKLLRLLPDFDDMEVEERALELAMSHPYLEAAVGFLVGWPDRGRAARLVLARAGDLDGNAYQSLGAAAASLEADYPLAATLLRRSMVQDTLDGAKSTRYGHAARHLAECLACDQAIEDYGDCPTHAQFIQTLRQKHGRKHGFWHQVDS